MVELGMLGIVFGIFFIFCYFGSIIFLVLIGLIFGFYILFIILIGVFVIGMFVLFGIKFGEIVYMKKSYLV